MKNKSLIKYLPPIIAFIIATTVLLALTNKDGDIPYSIKTTESAGIFYLTLSSLGGFLPPLIPAFAGFLMIFNSPKESKARHIVGVIFGALFVAFFTWFAWEEGHSIIVHHKTLFTVLIAVFLLLMDAVLGHFAYKLSQIEDKHSLLVGSIIIIVICFMSICGTEGVKLIVSRPRPIQGMINSGEYRHWYEFKPFQKNKHENWDSFVSGHASNSACLITTLPFLLSLTKLKNDKLVYIFGSVVGFLFMLVIASSRVLLKEHYVCDVAGSVIVSTVVQILTLVIVQELIFKSSKN